MRGQLLPADEAENNSATRTYLPTYVQCASRRWKCVPPVFRPRTALSLRKEEADVSAPLQNRFLVHVRCKRFFFHVNHPPGAAVLT